MNTFLSTALMALGLTVFGLASREARAETDAATEEASSSVVAPRDAASGLPTGKRQHKPVSVSTGDLDGDGAAGTRAQDHNSSRSNKSSSVAPRDAASGQATGKRQHKPVSGATGDLDGDGTAEGGAKVQDHNSSRSNKSGIAAPDGGDGTSEAEVQPQTYKAKAGKTGSAK